MPSAPPTLTDEPCPSCLECLKDGLRPEVVQRLPRGALAPMGLDRRKCCFDCAAAGTLLRVGGAPGFVAARIAVGNDRQEQYRLPGILMGLVKAGIVRPSARGDFEDQLAWLDRHNWFETRNEEAEDVG